MILHLLLPGRPESVRVARQAVEQLRGTMTEDTLDKLQLLISEVVTNSVRHSPVWDSDCIDVKVIELPDAVHVEVFDPGRGFAPRVHAPTFEQTSGWGLFLVDRLSAGWGVSQQSPTKVWFDIARAL